MSGDKLELIPFPELMGNDDLPTIKLLSLFHCQQSQIFMMSLFSTLRSFSVRERDTFHQ